MKKIKVTSLTIMKDQEKPSFIIKKKILSRKRRLCILAASEDQQLKRLMRCFQNFQIQKKLINPSI